MIFSVSIASFLTLIIAFSLVNTLCLGFDFTQTENDVLITFMRRGVGDKHPQQPVQDSQSGQRATHPISPQQHTQAQLRDILYHQAARPRNSPTWTPGQDSQTRILKVSKDKFNMVAVPDGLHDHEARAHVQNVQARAYADGHTLKGHAVFQVPPNHQANHDLPKLTIHAGRKTGLVHASFLQAPSTPRHQPQQQQRSPSASPHTPSIHTQTASTASLLDRVSGQPQTQPITQHAGDKRRREGSTSDHVDTTLKLGKRSVHHKVPSSGESVGIWKRGNGEKDSNSNTAMRKETFDKISSSIQDFRKFRDEGRRTKGISNIAVHADKRESNPHPQVSICDGRRAGHVITWVTQHPEQSRSGHQSEHYQRSTASSQHEPDVHVSGFVKLDNSNRNNDGHTFSRAAHNLYRNGHNLISSSTIATGRDPHSPHKYPAIHVRPGNQHARVLSTFIVPQRHPRSTTKNQHAPESSTQHQLESGQTTNLIDRIGSPSSPHSSSSDSSLDMHPSKKPRTDLGL